MSGTARNVAVLGTASGVGKTLTTVAICRWLRQRGIDVAPFKAMSMQDGDSFYRTETGSVIHHHQVYQASGARLSPEATMNPVAVWRHAGQVRTAVNGRRDDRVLGLAPRRRTAFLREAIMDSYRELSRRHEFIVIEGCGSPVELNLRRRDVSNLWLTNLIKAPCLLVGSVTHTGVFAAMIGTLSLMRPFERERVIGLVVNRYMGDPRDFISGMQILESRSGVPCWGTIPDYDGLGQLERTPDDPEQTRKLLETPELDEEIDRWTAHVAKHLSLDRLLR
ncbi:AAA family ATPase [Amycolatopsis sp. WGS_07]|uniref:nucleotide-binding protein n=1 Tax=Amycolatopsis sp. WGS_07 TaxID=3076764 RepID=UPI0038733599